MIRQTARVLALPALLLCLPPMAHAAETANSNASPDARRVLDYISRLPGRYERRVLSGQHIGQGEAAARLFADHVEGLQRASGKWVALLGADYGCPKGSEAVSPTCGRSAVNRLLAAYWKAGGLVTVSFQARNPWTGGPAEDPRVKGLAELTVPGSPAHAAWMKELAAAADALAELRDAGVVVLWRPFHAMNDSRYWWGRRDAEPFNKEGFVRLWRQMFDYFTSARKLNNLLWVYSAADAAHRRMSVTAYFPGKELCDIVGLDSFASEPALDGYNDMVRLGKPFGITAFGPGTGEPGPADYGRLGAALRFWYPQSSFFLAWSEASAVVRNPNGSVLMRDAGVVTRDEVGWDAARRFRWRQRLPLALRKCEVLTRDPACWKRVDVRVELEAAFESPFDPDQIAVDAVFTAPSGKTFTVPAFFDLPFERQVWGGERTTEEVMAEAGPPEWRVRFTPAEPGEHRLLVRARDRSGTVESAPVTFAARPAAGRGFVRVSQQDRRYFAFDDGTPFFPIGLNIVEHPLSEYYRYLPRLAASGGNFSRLWIGFDYFGLELGETGDYRLDNAWRLDRVMELSEQHGIYQMFCIDWIRYIRERGAASRGFDPESYAYGVSNGGPCRNMRDFFTLPEARRLFRNRLRYIVARWGYSPNVMAWELWNEIDLVEKDAARAEIVVPWNQEMCRYLQQVDPWRHLTTNSLSGRGLADALFSLEENQFAQRHGYLTPRPQAVQAAADMAGSAIRWLDDVDGFGKPYLLSEFGLQRDRMDVRAICDLDREGVHMHNGIWASVAHGAAGAAMLWWWGQYVDPKDLYRNFQGVAGFARGIPWTGAGFVRAEVETPGEELRALGLRGGPLTILWVQNRAHTWWNVISGAPIPPVEGGAVTVAGMAPGRYRVEYWDTYEGKVSATASATAEKGGLRLLLPRIEKDIAVKLYPE